MVALTIPFAVMGDGAAVEAPDTATGLGWTPLALKLTKARLVVGRRGSSPVVAARRDTPAAVTGRRAVSPAIAGQQPVTPPVTGKRSHARVTARKHPASTSYVRRR